ncbi:hypothetical protein Tco_1248056, partial [Tanacetum coccineum]
WLLTHGLELAIAKCLNSTEYLSSLGAAIGKAAEKGLPDLPRTYLGLNLSLRSLLLMGVPDSE